MLTPEQYEKMAGMVRENKIPDDLLDEAISQISEYKASAKRQTAPIDLGDQSPSAAEARLREPASPSTNANLRQIISREPTSFLSLEQKPLEQLVPVQATEAEKAVGTEKAKYHGYGEGQKGYNAYGPPHKLPTITAEVGTPKRLEEQQAWEQAFKGLHDPTKTDSQSQMADLYKPSYLAGRDEYPRPDLTATAPESELLGQAQQAILAAHGNLPKIAGGRAYTFFEPSLEEFRKTMEPVLGSEVNNMNEGSEQYKQFADARYKQEYEKAEMAGYPIIRHRFATGAGRIAGTIQKPLEAAAAGADQTMTLGLGAKLAGAEQGAERAMAENPWTALGGKVVGALNPIAPGNLLLQDAIAAAKRVPALANAIGGSRLGRIGASSLGAAYVGAAETAGGNLVAGRPISQNVGDTALISGLLGGGLGTVVEGARALRGFGAPPEIEQLREAGGETSFRHGVVPGKEMGALLAESKAMGPNGPSAQQILLSQMKGPVTEAAERVPAQRAYKHAQDLAAYEKQVAQYRVPISEAMNAAEKARKALTDVSGRSVDLGGEREQLEGLMEKLVDVGPPRGRYDYAGAPNTPDRLAALAEMRHGEDLLQKVNASPDLLRKIAEMRKALEAEAGGGPPAGKLDIHGATEAAPTSPALRGAVPKLPVQEAQARPISREELMPWHGQYLELPEKDILMMRAEEARHAGIQVPEEIPGEKHVFLAGNKKGIPAEGRLLLGFQARERGYRVPPGFSDHQQVVVAPRNLNASELSEMISSAHGLVEKGVPGAQDIERNLLKARDALPEKGPFYGEVGSIRNPATGELTELRGYSAAQRRASQEMQATQKTLERAGLTPGQEDQFFNVWSKYPNQGPGASPEVRKAIEEVAGWSGRDVQHQLNLIPGLSAYEKLREAGRLRNLVPLLRGGATAEIPFGLRGALPAIGMRLDPILGALSRTQAGRIGGMGGFVSQPLLEPDIEKIKQYLNQPKPEAP